MRMGDFGGVYLVTFIQILPPSAFFWELSKKWLDGCMDGWMLYGWMLYGYLKPVKPRAPCRANKKQYVGALESAGYKSNIEYKPEIL